MMESENYDIRLLEVLDEYGFKGTLERLIDTALESETISPNEEDSLLEMATIFQGKGEELQEEFEDED